MKLGVMTVLLGQKPLAEVAKYLSDLGVQEVEIGTGGYPGNAHCKPTELLGDKAAIQAFKNSYEQYGLKLSAFSVHGNYVHPDPDVAKGFQQDFENTIRLAGEVGIDRVIGFSGCPGGAPGDTMPNWVTCPWPDDFGKILDYQWNDVLIPYWDKMAKFATEYGVTRIALEMHPGFGVYNPETLLKLRDAVGPAIGANFDPSHLFWQGMDMSAAIRSLGDAIYYFHAKDTRIDPINTNKYGVLDTKHYGDEINRSWVFRSVGYGHGADVWKDIVSNLRMVGYDDVLSIEHEDSLMSADEGLKKAIGMLKECLCFDDVGGMWWA
jgi:sugar phosphate isomerase/epimerase